MHVEIHLAPDHIIGVPYAEAPSAIDELSGRAIGHYIIAKAAAKVRQGKPGRFYVACARNAPARSMALARRDGFIVEVTL